MLEDRTSHSLSTSIMDLLLQTLAIRDDYHCVDPIHNTASIPARGDFLSSPPLVDSLVVYIACRTLRYLALADEKDIWDLFGSGISRWPGSTSPTLQAIDEERAWVAHYRTASAVECQLHELRMALATVRLEFAPNSDLFTLGCLVDGRREVVAVRNKLCISSFLPRIERLLKLRRIEADEGLLPGRGLDVVVIVTAKAIVRECRHLIRSLASGLAVLTISYVNLSSFTVLRASSLACRSRPCSRHRQWRTTTPLISKSATTARLERSSLSAPPATARLRRLQCSSQGTSDAAGCFNWSPAPSRISRPKPVLGPSRA
ncbi:hypothetical protein DFH06DRAFT_1165379, partial [Mycena polygramma]